MRLLNCRTKLWAEIIECRYDYNVYVIRFKCPYCNNISSVITPIIISFYKKCSKCNGHFTVPKYTK
jgi:hypothetical protein